MQVQSIGNQSSVNFQSRHKHQNDGGIERASVFVNMDDDQLKYMASAASEDKHAEKKHKKNLLGLFYAMPIVSTIANGILPTYNVKMLSDEKLLFTKNVSLGERTLASAKTAGAWGLFLGIIGGYNLAKKAIVSNSGSLQRFEQDNPVASFIVDVGAILGGVVLGSIGLLHLHNKLDENNAISNKVDQAKNWLDNTKANKEIWPKVCRFGEKFKKAVPWLAKTGEFALRHSTPILFIASLGTMFAYSKHKHDTEKAAYHELKSAQFETAKELSNALGVERDILAQNDPRFAKSLRQEINNSEIVEEQ